MDDDQSESILGPWRTLSSLTSREAGHSDTHLRLSFTWEADLTSHPGSDCGGFRKAASLDLGGWRRGAEKEKPVKEGYSPIMTTLIIPSVVS